MVKVRWDKTTGALRSVCAADGPGQHTDDAETETVQDILQSVSTVDEETIAESVMKSYDGELQNYRCHVTVDTYTSTPDKPQVVTTIAFVEILGDEEKQDMFKCESCLQSESDNEGWEFRVREEGGWVYHDWKCPHCDSIVNTDLAKTPKTNDRIPIS